MSFSLDVKEELSKINNLAKKEGQKNGRNFKNNYRKSC